MSKKKSKKSVKKFVFIVLLSILLAFCLFAGYFFLTLPDVEFLKTKNPETTSLIEQRKVEAKKKKRKLKIHQKWVSFKAIPQLLKDTVRVSEDFDFYYHKGIDYYELKEAFKRNLKEGKKLRGASTITQQLAKNLFLSTEKSYSRKLREFFIAKKLEENLSKDRIFNIYLNIIELGNGIFGVEAASQYYFGKSVGDLELVEIIRLTAILPKPLKVNPLSKTSRYLKWRANLLLDRLIKYEYITARQYQYAKSIFR
jgi:monofunctional biosynthetic peptidoglycan transglycosylase